MDHAQVGHTTLTSAAEEGIAFAGLAWDDRVIEVANDEETHLQLCDDVSAWSNDLMGAIDEIQEWKNEMVTIKALPPLVIARLCMLTSKILRSKYRIQHGLEPLLKRSRDYARGVLLHDVVQKHKAALSQRTIALDVEKMRVYEGDRKLKAAIAQVIRLRSQHRLFRWYRLSQRMKARESSKANLTQTRSLLHRAELWRGLVTSLRLKLEQEQERYAQLSEFVERFAPKILSRHGRTSTAAAATGTTTPEGEGSQSHPPSPHITPPPPTPP